MYLHAGTHVSPLHLISNSFVNNKNIRLKKKRNDLLKKCTELALAFIIRGIRNLATRILIRYKYCRYVHT